MILNRDSLRAVQQGFNTIFQGALAGVVGQADFNRVATTVPSEASENVYPWLGNFFGLREWVGDRVVQNLATSKWTIENKDYEGTIAVKTNDIEDDKIGVYRPMIAQMGEGAAIHPNTLVFDLIRNGASRLCYDGQYFFDTDHPGYDANGAAVSVSNHMGGSGTAWYLMATKRAIKPFIFQKRKDYRFTNMDKDEDEAVFSRKELRYGVDARVNAGYGLPQLAVMSKQDLTAANYETARNAFAAFRKENGQPLGIVPDLLVVPQTLAGAGRRIVVSDTKANGETNEWKGDVDLMVTPWL